MMDEYQKRSLRDKYLNKIDRLRVRVENAISVGSVEALKANLLTSLTDEETLNDELYCQDDVILGFNAELCAICFRHRNYPCRIYHIGMSESNMYVVCVIGQDDVMHVCPSVYHDTEASLGFGKQVPFHIRHMVDGVLDNVMNVTEE